MSVGGWIIEIKPMAVEYEDGTQVDVIRIWCMDRNGTETCVYAEPAERLPGLGEEVWWQSGKIYFGDDKHILKKIGYSFSPRDCERADQ